MKYDVNKGSCSSKYMSILKVPHSHECFIRQHKLVTKENHMTSHACLLQSRSFWIDRIKTVVVSAWEERSQPSEMGKYL